MTPDAMERIEKDGMLLVQQAEDIRVVDAESFQQAGVFARRVTAGIKMAHELMDPVCESAHTAHKVAVAQLKKLVEPFETAKKLVGAQTAAWDQQERDRVRREQQAADAERRRLEDEERLRAATRLEAQGKPAAAEAALTAPVQVPVFTPPIRQAEKAEGLSFRDNWKAQVTDLMALVQAVAEGKASLACLEPNMVTLNGLARSLKDQMRVPGVEARNERISAVKA